MFHTTQQIIALLAYISQFQQKKTQITQVVTWYLPSNHPKLSQTRTDPIQNSAYKTKFNSPNTTKINNNKNPEHKKAQRMKKKKVKILQYKEKVSKAEKGHSQCGPCGHGRYRESLAV